MNLRQALAPLILGVAVAALTAACGSTSSGSAAGPHESPLPAAPASWTLGGAYTGPIPSAPGLPGPAGGLAFKAFTDSRGYTEQITIRVGVPLHFNIPRVLEGCYTAYPDYRSDLDPGLYVIPIQEIITNKTAQEAPAFEPAITSEAADGTDASHSTAAATVTGDLDRTWNTGSCRMDVTANLPVNGYATLSGFIGPATAKQLSETWLRISGAGGENQNGRWQLTTLEPHKTASWLISHS